MAKRPVDRSTPALFEDVAVPGTALQKQKKAPADIAPAKRLLDLYHARFVARHGCKPIISGAKDTGLLKKLIATWGEATVESLLLEYLDPQQRDPRVLRSDFTVGAFYGLAQYLMLRQGRTLPGDRTIENIDAATRAMRPHAS